jgi:hypothetical protein
MFRCWLVRRRVLSRAHSLSRFLCGWAMNGREFEYGGLICGAGESLQDRSFPDWMWPWSARRHLRLLSRLTALSPRPSILAHNRFQYAKGYIELGLINEVSEELEAINGDARMSAEVLRVRIDLHMEAKPTSSVLVVHSQSDIWMLPQASFTTILPTFLPAKRPMKASTA